MSEAKTILITGSTSGIGMEVSRYLYESGYRPVLAARNEEKAKRVSEELGDAPYVICDLENSEQIKDIFAFCQESGLKLDGMVHSAGYLKNMPIRVYKEQDAKRMMQLNYFAFLELCKHFYNRKVSNDGAGIVALSSLAVLTRGQGETLYAASKSALNIAVSTASKEFMKRSIRVNAVMPAYVDTPMVSGMGELVDFSELQPMGLIPARAIAETVEFLISEKSRYITGALIPISAGMDV